MKRSLLRYLLLLTVFLPSCRQESLTPRRSSGSLFTATEDTALFSTKPDTAFCLPADSAFKMSSAVIAGHLLFIDSTLHGGSKAPFYLICTIIDTVLKGPLRPGKKLYFAATILPHFSVQPAADWVIYLSGMNKHSGLLAYKLQWQWAANAPALLYRWPPKDTAIQPPRMQRKRRHRRYSARHLR